MWYLSCEAHTEAAGRLSEWSILGMNEPKYHPPLCIFTIMAKPPWDPSEFTPFSSTQPRQLWSKPRYWPTQQPLLWEFLHQWVAPLQGSSLPAVLGGSPLLCLVFKAHEHLLLATSPAIPALVCAKLHPLSTCVLSWTQRGYLGQKPLKSEKFQRSQE